MFTRFASGILTAARITQSVTPKLLSIQSRCFIRSVETTTQFDVLNPTPNNDKPKNQRKPMNRQNRSRQANSPNEQVNKENKAATTDRKSNRVPGDNRSNQNKKRSYESRNNNKNGVENAGNPSFIPKKEVPNETVNNDPNVYTSKKHKISLNTFGMKSINEFKYPNLENNKEKVSDSISPRINNNSHENRLGSNQRPKSTRNLNNNHSKNQRYTNTTTTNNNMVSEQVQEEEEYPDVEIPSGPFNLPFPDEIKELLLTKEVNESEMFDDVKDKPIDPFNITEGEDIEQDESKWRTEDYNFNGAKIEIETRQYVIPQTRETDIRGLHPGNRKVILRVHVKDLKLPIMTAQKLVLLSGPRYNFKNDVLTLTSDRYPLRRQNARWLVDTLEALIQEASVPTPVEELPTLKPLKTPRYPYPVTIYNSTK